MDHTKQQNQSLESSQMVSNIVLETSKLVSNLYGQVKEYSPLLKTNLENVESHIPAKLINQVETAVQPVISNMDKRVDQLKDSVSKTISKVNDGYIAPVGNALNDKVFVPVQELRSITADDIKKAAKDRLDMRINQFNDLRDEFTKKTFSRLEKGLADVKEFSATHGKEIIHIDLIQYSREVLGNAKVSVEPLISSSVSNISNAAAAIKEYSEEKTALSKQKVGEVLSEVNQKVTDAIESARALSESGNKKVEQIRSELKSKLADTIESARTLSKSGANIVQIKYQDLKASIPDKFSSDYLLSKLPENLKILVPVDHPIVQSLMKYVHEVAEKLEPYCAQDDERKSEENKTQIIESNITINESFSAENESFSAEMSDDAENKNEENKNNEVDSEDDSE